MHALRAPGARVQGSGFRERRGKKVFTLYPVPGLLFLGVIKHALAGFSAEAPGAHELHQKRGRPVLVAELPVQVLLHV